MTADTSKTRPPSKPVESFGPQLAGPSEASIKRQVISAWVLGGVLLVFSMVVSFVIPGEVSRTCQMLRVLSALLAGLFAFFLVGSIRIDGQIPIVKAVGGKLTVQATAGFAMFVLVAWPAVSPVPEPDPQLSNMTFYVRRDLQDSTTKGWPLVEDGANAVTPLELQPLGLTDDFKLVGMFDRPTRWFVFWIDTAGEADVVCSESSEAAIAYPPGRMFVPVNPADPPGVHLLYLLADPGGVVDVGAVSDKLGRLGSKPDVVAAYATLRGTGMKRLPGLTTADDYLNRVEAVFPDGALPVCALFIPWSPEESSRRLTENIHRELERNRPAEAWALAERLLAFEREHYGLEHVEVLNTLIWIGKQIAPAARAWDHAVETMDEAVSLAERLHGVQHWRTTDVRVDRLYVTRLWSLSPEARKVALDAIRRQLVVVSMQKDGQYEAALELARSNGESLQVALGDKHPFYGVSLNNLADLYKEVGDYARAEPLYQQALEITKAALGDKHPSYGTILSNLAGLYRMMGDYARAEPLYQEALEITKAALGDNEPSYGMMLSDLAGLYKATGEYARAEPLYQQALEITKAALGDKHPSYGSILNNLAVLYQAMGDYARAELFYQQDLEIRETALGDKHPSYAATLNNVAGLYVAMGDYARAERLYQQALEIMKAAVGDKHPSYGTFLNNLAELYTAMGDYARAEPLYLQDLKIRKAAVGDKHPSYAMTMNNLAGLYVALGDYARAERLYQQALEIMKAAVGDKHPSYGTFLNNLAELYKTMGDYARAEQLSRQASEIRKGY